MNETKPDTHFVNERYQSYNNTGDNIYFFVADEDPWKHVNIKMTMDFTDTTKVWYINCNDCAHCVDMLPPSDNDDYNLTAARLDAFLTIKKWLEDDTMKKNLIKQSD